MHNSDVNPAHNHEAHHCNWRHLRASSKRGAWGTTLDWETNLYRGGVPDKPAESEGNWDGKACGGCAS